jgi:hypothetical protein
MGREGGEGQRREREGKEGGRKERDGREGKGRGREGGQRRGKGGSRGKGKEGRAGERRSQPPPANPRSATALTSYFQPKVFFLHLLLIYLITARNAFLCNMMTI